jgi:hypothetical protein
MERHEWTPTLDYSNRSAWMHLVESKPSTAERFAARTFRRQQQGTTWWVQALMIPTMLLCLVITDSTELDWFVVLLLVTVGFQGVLLSWERQGFCDLLVRTLADSQRREPGAR